MSIIKCYEVTCDYCGTCINHYIGRKPTMQELRNDGFATTATKVFCDDRCRSDYLHDLEESRYNNLRNTKSKRHFGEGRL